MQQAPCIFQTNKHRYLKQILLFDFYTVISQRIDVSEGHFI